MIDRREFGFFSFEGQMLRHKTFKNTDELAYFLKDFVPKDAYFSCAYYENPEAEMERKGWLGADLIFDVDADHIPTGCDKIHDEWTCGGCGFSGRGIVPDRCPICEGEKFTVTTWPCENCLASAKEETIKLLDMLMEDFGLSKDEIKVFFSGHRGYHVHVECEAVKTLDGIARKEIVDYITGLGLETSAFIEEKMLRRMQRESRDTRNFYGWKRRISIGLSEFFKKTTEEELIEIGLKRNVAKNILMGKNALLKNEAGKEMLRSIKGLGFKTWTKIFEHVAKAESSKIDTVVTTDIHRLIRLPETLHGKTGFKKVEFAASKVESFDPFKKATAFKKGKIKVFVYDAPEFRINEETFGPYKARKVELPTAAALLLLCKNKAEVSD
ncbi:MAG: DNA primase small subunit domain-containing protein [Candidatus Bathyarchaeia archaeon]